MYRSLSFRVLCWLFGSYYYNAKTYIFYDIICDIFCPSPSLTDITRKMSDSEGSRDSSSDVDDTTAVAAVKAKKNKKKKKTEKDTKTKDNENDDDKADDSDEGGDDDDSGGEDEETEVDPSHSLTEELKKFTLK